MALGTPRTPKFKIGTAEVRVGPLSSAGLLTQSHSIGLLDSVSIEVSQESVDLEGGFPKILVDTAVIKQSASMTATLREYSRRNLRLMLGEGVAGTPPSDFSIALGSDHTAGSTIICASDVSASISAGDVIVLYPNGAPELLSVVTVASVATATITPEGLTPTLYNLVAADGATIYKANPVGIGAITNTNYFSVTILGTDRETGRPVGYNFWKAAISGGMTDSQNSSDFSSTDLAIKFLVPAATEYANGGALVHQATVIPANPTGMYFSGGDA